LYPLARKTESGIQSKIKFKPYCPKCGNVVGKKKKRLGCAYCSTSVIKVPITYMYDLILNEITKCITCNVTFSIGDTMRMHLKGPLCKECHKVSYIYFEKEYISDYVNEPGAIYDEYNHRLCDIYGCNVYGITLNNDYMGFFCNYHYKQMRDIRQVIKGKPNTWDEYNARMCEISIRKNPSIDHIKYAANLYIWLVDMQNINYYKHIANIQTISDPEAAYINNFFM
jgi:hypothetical protein